MNYNDADPTSWLWIGDRFLSLPESQRFYAPVLSNRSRRRRSSSAPRSVWRTTNAGGDRAFLEAHCNTAIGEFPSDLLYTGACGDNASWPKLGTSTLTNNTVTSPYEHDEGRQHAQLARPRARRRHDVGNCRHVARLEERERRAGERDVQADRHRGAASPAPSTSIFVDRTNPDHAIVTFSGFEANTPTTLGRVFDVVFDAVAGTATWTNMFFLYDVGDQPVNDAVLDSATGNVYVSTRTVLLLEQGTQTWVPRCGTACRPWPCPG